jgi:hypothetical protein
MANELLVERLRAWLRSGAAGTELSVTDLHPEFSYEDGAFRVQPPDAAGHATMTNGRIEELTFLEEVVTPDRYVAVARGRDEVTLLWHQFVWVFVLREGRVLRMVVTHSAQLPPRPYDGTLPLREAKD